MKFTHKEIALLETISKMLRNSLGNDVDVYELMKWSEFGQLINKIKIESKK